MSAWRFDPYPAAELLVTDVFSKRLVGPVTVTGSSVVLATVPAGHTYVVKCVMASNDGNTVTSRLLVGVGPLNVAANRVMLFDIAPKAWRTENVTLTVHAGETIQAMASLGPGLCQITMSGYDLQN